MSIKALNWAYAQPVKGPAKAVLCALAFRANGKTGLCNPSLARLSLDSGLSRTAVKSAIRALADARLIRVRPGDRTSSNVYILNNEQSKPCGARGDLGGRARDDLGREATGGRARDDHKHGSEHKGLSQEGEFGGVGEERDVRARLRVVGGDGWDW